jgi:hypothetical protein
MTRWRERDVLLATVVVFSPIGRLALMFLLRSRLVSGIWWVGANHISCISKLLTDHHVYREDLSVSSLVCLQGLLLRFLNLFAKTMLLNRWRESRRNPGSVLPPITYLKCILLRRMDVLSSKLQA